MVILFCWLLHDLAIISACSVLDLPRKEDGKSHCGSLNLLSGFIKSRFACIIIGFDFSTVGFILYWWLVGVLVMQRTNGLLQLILGSMEHRQPARRNLPGGYGDRHLSTPRLCLMLNMSDFLMTVWSVMLSAFFIVLAIN